MGFLIRERKQNKVSPKVWETLSHSMRVSGFYQQSMSVNN